MILFNLSLKEGFELNNHEADLAKKGKKKFRRGGFDPEIFVQKKRTRQNSKSRARTVVSFESTSQK